MYLKIELKSRLNRHHRGFMFDIYAGNYSDLWRVKK